jgi:hypothetical protein
MRIQPSVNVSQVESPPATAAKPQAKAPATAEPAATVKFSGAALQAAAGKVDADGDGDGK